MRKISEKAVKKPLKYILQINSYDSNINNISYMINDEIPEFAKTYTKNEGSLVNQLFSKASMVDNILVLLSWKNNKV